MLLCLPPIAGAGCGSPTARPLADLAREAIRGLGERALIVQAPYFLDGGSIGLTLRSPEGQELKCGINRASILEETEGGSLRPVYPPGALLIHGHHVTDEGALIVDHGSPAEEALIRLVETARIRAGGSVDGYQTAKDLEAMRQGFLRLHRELSAKRLVPWPARGDS